jgi:RimJ/RimL family protein N-acetyltransferase
MSERHEYSLELSATAVNIPPAVPAAIELRPPGPADARPLAELMIEAYRGTIDYDDETVEDALGEIDAYLAGRRGGRPLLDASRLAFAGRQLVGACLVAFWDERQQPLIAYVMTDGTWKGQGVGRALLAAGLDGVREAGYRQVWAVITAGNEPSERLFAAFGFRQADGA